MNKNLKRGVVTGFLLTMLINLTACGYFLYPERKGQAGGRVDPVVVILDGAGLLFGLLPGLVAFAVDFTNGTIYLPPGGTSAVDRHLGSVDTDEAEKVIDQNGQVWLRLPIDSLATEGGDLQQLSAALSNATGQRVAVQDIVWMEDLAALREATSERTAGL